MRNEAPACVYRFFDTEGALIYVGCTTSPSRIDHHRYLKRWFKTVATVTLVHYDTRQEALAAELAAIRSEMPRFNYQGAQVWRKVVASLPVLAAAVLLLTSCGVRETREEIKDIGGYKALCSWTHNNWSGNDTDETCIPVSP